MRKWLRLTIYLIPYAADRIGKNSRVFYKIFNSISLTKSEEKYMNKIIQKFSKISLIVIKKTNNTECLCISKPCVSCIKIMKLLKMKNIYYSDANGDIILEKINNISSCHESQMLKFMNTDRFY